MGMAPSPGPQLGCIADDFTGATDLASTLVAQGMRTVVLLGEPAAGLPVPQADALVVALKSRSIPAAGSGSWRGTAIPTSGPKVRGSTGS